MLKAKLYGDGVGVGGGGRRRVDALEAGAEGDPPGDEAGHDGDLRSGIDFYVGIGF